MSSPHFSVPIVATSRRVLGQAASRIAHRALRIDPYLLLVILFSLFPVGPLLQPGYFWDAHDARHSVYFVYELDRGIQDGVLYPRWQPDFAFGYGYPFFNIYGPLSSYATEALHLLGTGFADAVKIVFGLSIVASGLAMYGFMKQVLGRRAGLVAAVAYMVIPYRLVDIYVRAALAEAVAYVFVPLVLWGVWAAIRRPRLANVVGLAVAYAALIVTHPLTALLVTCILVAYVVALALVRANENQPLRRLSRQSLAPLLAHLANIVLPVAAGLVLGVGLCAFFFLPAMTENRFVRVDQWYGGRYAWGGDFVDFFQLFSPRWGFGPSVPGPNDTMSFQLGVVPVVLSLFGVVGTLRRRTVNRINRIQQDLQEKDKDIRPVNPEKSSDTVVFFFAGLGLVAVFLMLSVSAPLWAALPLARLAQFPWRLLSFVVVALAVLCGAVASGARRHTGARLEPGAPRESLPGWSTLLLVALLILGSLPYMHAQMSEREVSLAGLIQFQQSSDEMTGSTAWVRQIPRWSSMADFFIAGAPYTSKMDFGLFYAQPGNPQARPVEIHREWEIVEYYAQRPVLITFDTFYYPGWHAYLLDAQTNAILHELPIALRGNLGLMTVQVPAGIGRVLIRFEDTPIRRLGETISLASAGLVIVAVMGQTALRRRRARG